MMMMMMRELRRRMINGEKMKAKERKKSLELWKQRQEEGQQGAREWDGG